MLSSRNFAETAWDKSRTEHVQEGYVWQYALWGDVSLIIRYRARSSRDS